MKIDIKNNKIRLLSILALALLVVFVLILAVSCRREEAVTEKYIPAQDAKIDSYQFKDGKVYYRQAGNLREVAGAEMETFEALDDNYARDAHRAYFRNFAIPGAEAATFEPIDELYSKDAVKVFCSELSVYREEIPEAEAATFQKVGGNFYKDKNYVFEKCRISEIPNLDPETFAIVDEKTVKDKNGVYNLE